MECPNKDGVLERHTIGGVEVDECPNCRGIWFDAGELNKAKDAVDPDLRWMDIELWKEGDQFSLSVSERNCPVDGSRMVSMEYGDTGVVVDHCLTCNGFWLDQGEFLEIIGALEQELLEKSSDEYVDESLEEAGEVVTGPEGFLSEWRDFLTVTRLMQYRLLAENPRLREALLAFQRASPFQ